MPSLHSISDFIGTSWANSATGCPAAAAVLDFGCGTGDVVTEYRRRGFQAVGCDIELERTSEELHLIDPTDYRIPFAEHSFDFVFSDQVMEHVRDHASAINEIGGCSSLAALAFLRK